MAKKRTTSRKAGKAGRNPSHPRISQVARAGTNYQRRPPEADNEAQVTMSDGVMGEAQTESLPPFLIVGMGASAGGVEALTQFFRAMPANTGMVFIVVPHIARSQEGMPDVLRTATGMTVVQAVDGMALEADHVYVAPPGAQVELEAGMLRLIPRPVDRSQYTPIDHFFRSLADYARSRAVGIVLSGMASDGSAGLRDVKGAGGIAIAQEPQSALHDSMPRSAIATGSVDLVLTPAAMAEELVRIASHPLVDGGKGKRPAELIKADEGQWAKVFKLLRQAGGVDFTYYKQPTIQRRLQRRMVLHKTTSVGEYLRLLQANPAEVKALYQDLLIHVTRFFRDPESFEVLATLVFPQVAKAAGDESPIRIWVPGCSTGEEPYSIAIALLEFLGDKAAAVPIQMFATDVSDAAVEQARAGVYPDNIAADVSPERLRRFFSKVDGHYRVSKQVRDLCVFARQDLTRDPPFSKLDFIVCRNVLIYLGTALQKKLMTVFHYALKSTGFLMLGGAESIGTHSDLFAVADKRHKVFSKKLGAVKVDMDFPPLDPLAGRVSGGGRPAPEAPPGVTLQHEANRIILGRYSPPGVIVDRELRIVQFRGQTGEFLEPAPGEASLQLLKMAREGLLYGLRAALNEAQRSQLPVHRGGLRVQHDGVVREVSVEVIPLAPAGEGAHLLVLFETETREAEKPVEAPAGPVRGKKGEKGAKGEPKAAVRITRLQQELAANREYLQSIIQDLEAANEELQSANEEILSSNEELQSTNEELDTAKEELQSTNEELNTVNDELRGRNEELSRANSDLTNLLASVQIAIVMVAADLRVRRFTPTAEQILNLIPTDVGRPISDIKPNIDCPDLANLIVESIETVTVRERQVKDLRGHWYTLRIRPYKNVENRIDGAVIALFDTEDDSRISELAEAHAYAEGLLETVREPLLVLEPDLRVRSANKAFCDSFAVSALETEGKYVYDLGNRQWDIPRLRMLLQDVLPKDRRIEGFRVDHDFPGLGKRTMAVNARRLERSDHSPGLILLAIEDISRHNQ